MVGPDQLTWSFACPDWRQRLASGTSLVPALPLDEAEAKRAVGIFDRLRLPDVEGMPRLADAAADWFRDIVRAVFGSVVGGVRRVPGVFVLVPKKNSKTTNGAALMLTALLMNRRPNALFGLFGPTQEIADTAFAAARGMIEADEDLRALFHVQEHVKTITYRRSKAKLKVTTWDPQVATGGKFAGWLLDELHLLGKSPMTARILGQIRGARSAIPESFGIIITTQSEDPPAGAFKAELQYARAVRDGSVPAAEATVLPVLYELPEDVQTDTAKPWRDPSLWPQVLPNLGRSVSIEVLRQDYATARAKGDEEERRWASQHLNIEIGLALHSDRWPGADHWEAAAVPGLTLDALIEQSEVATIGIDGGGLDDLLGVAVLGRHAVTKRWYLWSHAYADRGVLHLRKEIAPRLLDFERDGDLTVVDIGHVETGANADVRGVADIVERVHAAGLLPSVNAIGLDPVGVAAICDELELRQIPREMMVGVPQGYRLSGVIKGAARKLKDGTLRHGGRPMMAWCVGNAKQEAKGSAVVITKQAAGTAKIDPLVALFNAFDLMSRNPEPPSSARSYLETSPLVVL